MYLRTTSRKNKNGSPVDYVHLAHNVWDADKGYAKAEVIYSFGRVDKVDVEAIKRLIKSLSRFLDANAPSLELPSGVQGDAEFQIASSKPFGGAFLLRSLWSRLGIGDGLRRAIRHRGFSTPIEEAVFAMVANRALAPSSKLAIEDWAREDVYLGNSEPFQVQHFYRGMDFLLERQEAIQKDVFWATASLLNLEVDLIFFDTTSTYFETEDVGESELKRHGHSKDKREDLPQVTIGLAVTRQGIPVRCWVFPGNQNDAKSVDRVQRDLAGWSPGRVVWVMDRGMTSDENKRILQRAGGDYILGEKIRATTRAKEALARPGRFRVVTDNLHIKEVFVGSGLGKQRYVVAYNPDEAERDKKTRKKLLERITGELDGLKTLPEARQEKARCHLLEHRSMKRFVEVAKDGSLRLNKAKIREEEKLDGKYLLSTSSADLPAEDVALGYKQLLEVERAFRTLKTSLDLRPVYHFKDERICAHVLHCWLALLLVRIIEVETGMSWDKVRREMERLHFVELFGKGGRVLQRTKLTNDQANILKKLKISPPKRIQSIDPS